MKEFLLTVQSRFQKYWQNLSSAQKIVVPLLMTLIFVSLIGMTFWMTKGEYSVLFSNLGSEDAASVVSKLKEENVPYRLSRAGTVILVPSRQVYDLRISLAGDGIPKGGGVGFEVFDNKFFGMTEFTQKLNFQRALQGELERTIREISSIEGVRVHLVLPEEKLFIEEQKEPSASVLLKLSLQAKLTKQQIRGIVNLIKTSVENLKEENISIIDTHGNILCEKMDEEFQITGTMNDIFQMKKKIAADIQDEVRLLIERIVGQGKVAVKASVEIELTREETTREEYIPVIDEKKGIVRSEQKKIEYFKGGGAQSGGVPGVATNLSSGGPPGYAQTGGGGNTSDYTKEETVTNFEITKNLSHIVSVPGEITRITISVLLDGDFSQEMLETIKQVVSSGVGIEEARGDEVVVESFHFDKSYIAEGEKELERLKGIEFRNLVVKSVVVGIVCLIIFLFTVSMIRHSNVINAAKRNIEKTKMGEGEGEEVIPQAAEALRAAYLQGEDIDMIRKQVADIAKNEPEKIARVIKTLMAGSGE